jgi:putative hydroxymethylpyrimidine transport system ATP-binding protein
MLTKAAPTIFLNEIFLSYGKDVLFNNFNLKLTGGKCTCLLGPSGVGKTTLLRLIAGLIPITPTMKFHGQISANNQPLDSNQIAYMAQEDLLLPWFNALDNALLGARLRGDLNAVLLAEAMHLFAAMDLSAAMLRYPAQLSGGMRQRVALIRTLLEAKPIVLMDEPFSAVDTITRFNLQNLAAELLKQSTVFLVTHDLLEALRLADEIYILSGPNTPQLAVKLITPAPRALDNPEVVNNQAKLFNLLTDFEGKTTGVSP